MNIIERLRLTGLKRKLDSAFKNNSEQELLKVLKDNSFLFYELVERTAEETPIFHEIPFGNYAAISCGMTDHPMEHIVS